MYTDMLFILLLLAATLGPVALRAEVTIGGVTYDSVDTGSEFTELVDDIVHRRQDWVPPSPTVAEVASGFVVYVTADPGHYRPYRVPKDWEQEHVTNLSTFLSPGEDKAAWFGLYALEELQDLAVTVEAPDMPFTVDVRNMWFWPQRTGTHSRQWYMTPELLLPCQNGRTMAPTTGGVLEWRPFHVLARESAGLWLTVTAPPEAPPGSYAATIRVSSADKPDLLLPFTVEILPLILRRPADRHWLVYCDLVDRQGLKLSDAQRPILLRDFARHGITGLIEVPLGEPDASRLKEGRARFDASPFITLARQAREAGLPGPHVCHYGEVGKVAGAVQESLGLANDDLQGEWPTAYRDGVVALARAAVEATQPAGVEWYVYPFDEPSQPSPHVLQTYEAWRAGGAKTYVTWWHGTEFLQQAAPHLSVICFGRDALQVFGKPSRGFCRQVDAEFWFYGSGCYDGQEAQMFSNRYAAGFLMWNSGATAHATWTFCRLFGDPFNDFDGSAKDWATAYPHLLQPNDWSTFQGVLPTLAWESIREGINDYRYLDTLQSLIEEVRNDPREPMRAAAAQAAERLRELGGQVGGGWLQGTSPQRMNEVRRHVADQIVALQPVMADHGTRPE